MQNRITKKVDTHVTAFKEDIKDWFDTNKADISGDSNKNAFLQFIFDYDALSLSNDDFTRRKRLKNTVPLQIRCHACRANGEQCTRRQKDGEEYCGTHIKGTPYGVVQTSKVDVVSLTKKQVWIQEIKGINYFIDDDNNIYLHSEIINNSNNPTIIGKYSMNNGKYSICGELS